MSERENKERRKKIRRRQKGHTIREDVKETDKRRK
jgi:hypothetical protein